MFSAIKQKKNYLRANDLIKKGMLKRRNLAYRAILNICDCKQKIRLVK